MRARGHAAARDDDPVPRGGLTTAPAEDPPAFDRETREAALCFFGSLGLATVPLRPREKRPLFAGWQRADPSAWRDAPVDANVGVVTGARSGDLVVLDFDGPSPAEILGVEPLELAQRTLVVRTARGWHVYTRAAGIGTCRWRGADVKAEGGLVVAPPSIHPSGHPYASLPGARRIAALSAVAGGGRALAEEQAPREAKARPDPVRPGFPRIEAARAWLLRQAPRLRRAWTVLESGAPPSHFDRSRAEFAIALSLAEGGFSQEEAVAVLLALDGGKARERGEDYTLATVRRAFALRGA